MCYHAAHSRQSKTVVAFGGLSIRDSCLAEPRNFAVMWHAHCADRVSTFWIDRIA